MPRVAERRDVNIQSLINDCSTRFRGYSTRYRHIHDPPKRKFLVVPGILTLNPLDGPLSRSLPFLLLFLMPPVSRSQIEAHEIHRGKGLNVRLSLALAMSIIQVTAWNYRGRKYSPVPCTRDSAHKTFGPTDLTSTYPVCTRRVFGGIGHRTQAFRSGVRCSNH
ncbi:hypothetical protein TNCV_145541 [Trichonephila clavipes]|nr:hypothetical protein TNCV_145541 [Trichonephila clavipes]